MHWKHFVPVSLLIADPSIDFLMLHLEHIVIQCCLPFILFPFRTTVNVPYCLPIIFIKVDREHPQDRVSFRFNPLFGLQHSMPHSHLHFQNILPFLDSHGPITISFPNLNPIMFLIFAIVPPTMLWGNCRIFISLIHYTGNINRFLSWSGKEPHLCKHTVADSIASWATDERIIRSF